MARDKRDEVHTIIDDNFAMVGPPIYGNGYAAAVITGDGAACPCM